jgi:hypothetical protein
MFRSIRSIFLAVVTYPMTRRNFDVLDLIDNRRK